MLMILSPVVPQSAHDNFYRCFYNYLATCKLVGRSLYTNISLAVQHNVTQSIGMASSKEDTYEAIRVFIYQYTYTRNT